MIESQSCGGLQWPAAVPLRHLRGSASVVGSKEEKEEEQSFPTGCWLRPADVRQIRSVPVAQRGGNHGPGKATGVLEQLILLVAERLFVSIE